MVAIIKTAHKRAAAAQAVYSPARDMQSLLPHTRLPLELAVQAAQALAGEAVVAIACLTPLQRQEVVADVAGPKTLVCRVALVELVVMAVLVAPVLLVKATTAAPELPVILGAAAVVAVRGPLAVL